MARKITTKQTAEEKAAVRQNAREARRAQLVFYEKYLLTVDEAIVYFHIGGRKMAELIHNHPNAKWILMNGKRTMIKKDMFATWLDQQSEI